MDSVELEQLLGAARRGDQRAFAKLTQAHYRLVYSLAYSTVGDWSAAQDIAQDTFLVAWKNLGNLRYAGAFPMWIRKIARNLSLNWIRSADYRRRLTQRHEEFAAHEDVPAESAVDTLQREERRAAVWQALQQLSPPVREAMVLFYIEGRSVTESATHLGVTENAFKLRLHTGRTRLRKHYESQLEESLQRDLVPPNATAATNRILAGLAAGPVLPHVGNIAGGGGLELWWHHLTHNTSADWLAPLLKGAVLVNAKKIAIVATATVLCVGGAYWGLQRGPDVNQQSGENWRRVAKTESDSGASTLSAPEPGGNETTLAKSAKAADQYAPPAGAQGANETAALANLEVSGDVTASAALLMSMEKGKIPDPKDYASVAGTVEDSHGNPIGGATVQVFATGGDRASPANMQAFFAVQQNPAHKFTALTDNAGRFIVEGIAYEGSASITAFADGFSLDRRRRVEVPIAAGAKVSNIRIVLEAGKGLYGKLLAPDGSPVPDGVVNLVAFRSRGESPNGNLATTNTDANGIFRLALPREGVVCLVTSSLKYGGASFDDVPVGTEDIVELQMPKSARLEGTITWANGSPASDLLVYLIGQANDGRGQRRVHSSVYAGKTDAGGSYVIDAIDANQLYMVSVSHPDQTPLSQPNPLPDFAPGATQKWDYVIQDLITVRGTVVGEQTGQPLRDIKVAALKDGKPVQSSETPVGVDGTYEMRLTSGPGTYVIYPRLWRIEPETTGYDYGKTVALTADQETTVDLTFMDTATMSIRVVDASGQPVKGMMLAITENDHTWMPVAVTPSDGRFTWGGFMPGAESNFAVYDSRDQVGKTQATVCEPGQTYPEETVVVYGSAGIEGIAQVANGQPLANGVVIVRIFYALTRELERKVNTDQYGHFLIENGLPATGVIIELDGYAESSEGVNKYTCEGAELELTDKVVSDLGTLSFALNESNIEIND